MGKEARESIAIFGGSFDPPHKGHQLIVSKAVESLDIDRLFIVPAYLNPFKQSSLAPANLRLQWCHTLFDPLEKVSVSDYEILQGKSTYTADTVRHFQNAYDVKYFIIGSDNLGSLTKWHQYEWLNQQVTWVVATRKNSSFDTGMLRKWVKIELDEEISSTHIRSTQQLDGVDKKIAESVKQVLTQKESINKG
ncbi:nicotinate (nicotinamide) nucleotide adenylyltransferase [Sulfurovum sp. zt1-1]|uniref:Probable nicotinate-nucleotide adenylyltransferase n=1 Tax=Sulfurovum zhangzhouensis TaxID=3019067 RepID=A0ABT7QXB2_9BACT|nr:nicotinate (nicotinamide) nucleotide adenylyltransferase [Sulfurovum zhangzhouensis]MDM5271467.1 nicotinate (nicotinamide) nucleotide adenylyltransferase [Sulfurovum zhangzhouensis]